MSAARAGSDEISDPPHERGVEEEQEEDELIDDDEVEMPEGGFSRDTTAEASGEEDDLPVLLRSAHSQVRPPSAERSYRKSSLQGMTKEPRAVPTSSLIQIQIGQTALPVPANQKRRRWALTTRKSQPRHTRGARWRWRQRRLKTSLGPCLWDSMLQSEIASAVPPLVIDDTGSGIPSPRDDADDPMSGPADMLPSDIFGAINEAYRFIDAESQPSTPAAMQVEDPSHRRRVVQADRNPSTTVRDVDMVIAIWLLMQQRRLTTTRLPRMRTQ